MASPNYLVSQVFQFNLMAAGWFCEKPGWIGKVEDVLLKKTRISTGNHLEEEDLPRWIVK